MKTQHKNFYRAAAQLCVIALIAVTTTVSQAQNAPVAADESVQYKAVPIPDAWPEPLHDSNWNSLFLIDLLEYQIDGGADTWRWDIQGWIGGDVNRLWFKSEGDAMFSPTTRGEGDVQLLYSRLIAPFWDFQIGGRYEQAWASGAGGDPSRFSAVVGFQGLAPYWFELEPSFYLSQDGDISAELTASYDLLLTQRLILQPRLDTTAAVQQVSQFGVGQGLNDIELGLRLRYEIKREFAPYVGITWKRLLGETASLARGDGEDTDIFSVVFGIRMWF